MTRGVILHGTGGAWHVRCEDGATVVAALRGSVKHESDLKLAVGDQVMLRHEARGAGFSITEVFPRRSRLARRSPGRTPVPVRTVGAAVPPRAGSQGRRRSVGPLPRGPVRSWS